MKAFLVDFARQSCGAIPRSVLHLAISGKLARPGEPLGLWLPRKPMLAAALRLPSAVLPCADSVLFLDQACLAVSESAPSLQHATYSNKFVCLMSVIQSSKVGNV